MQWLKRSQIFISDPRKHFSNHNKSFYKYAQVMHPLQNFIYIDSMSPSQTIKTAMEDWSEMKRGKKRTATPSVTHNSWKVSLNCVWFDANVSSVGLLESWDDWWIGWTPIGGCECTFSWLNWRRFPPTLRVFDFMLFSFHILFRFFFVRVLNPTNRSKSNPQAKKIRDPDVRLKMQTKRE